MTAGKCLRLQEEALDFFGADKAGKCSTCPCEQGIEIRRGIEMAKKRGKKICVNCGRLMFIAQGGLCGGCWCRTRGLTGEDREEALKKAAADFGVLPPGKRGPQRKYTKGPRVKPVIQDAEKRGGLLTEEEFLRQVDEVAAKHPGLAFEPVPVPDHPGLNEAPLLTVIVNFTDGDGPLFDGLMKLGRKYRRSPDQQLLWLLEKELHNEGILQADPAMFLYPAKPAEKAERLPEFPEAFTGTDPKMAERYVS